MRRVIALCVVLATLLLLTSCGMSKKNQKTIDTISSKSLGDEVVFGSYNGKKLIWNVVYTEDGLYLLVLKGNLDIIRYSRTTQGEDANEWSNCDLRTWLNGAFYNSAFDDNAKSAIVTCDLYNSYREGSNKSGGKDTQDRVFILSYAECKKFLEPLELVLPQGKKDTDDNDYWLRNPSGTYSTDVMTVDQWKSSSSTVGTDDADREATWVCVRPAIWITDSGATKATLHVDPVKTEDIASSSNSSVSNSKKRCYVCGGTGFVQFNYGSSDLEAILSGHDSYTVQKCYKCGGSGYVYD